jgi:hypothetical protein
MKYSLLALCPALLLTSCADVRVTHTDVATGATHPSAIYIKPFDISDATFTGRYVSPAEAPIKESLAPAVFSEDLKEELEKLAPALVLKPGDVATTGWLVEGSIERVDAGSPAKRGAGPTRCGASHIAIHVRVIDLDTNHVKAVDAKDATGDVLHAVKARHGVVIYEFDLAGGSKGTGPFGSVTAPGLGYAPMFDYRNAAERVYEALDPDEFKFGLRDSPTDR